jgi:cellulose synthase/poly-beta-1,6-N-acetylglucosamine synthase-like glycosyltransferase
VVERLRSSGAGIDHIRRGSRDGYKAGALAFGMTRSSSELFAVFDADFVPPADSLLRMVPEFANPSVGMVQARWGHLNRDESLLTRAQAIFLDAHFAIESAARFAAGHFFNFNGTAGIWRRRAIEDAGGWSASTLTEDLDLSYRAQLAGWKFVFLRDVEVPAELPPTIGAFQEQQFRWTKGSIQTARRLLLRILRAHIPAATKIEAVFHLTANAAYLLTFLLALLLVPSMEARRSVHWTWSYVVDAFLFGMSTLAVMRFYIEGQYQIGRMRPSWTDLCLLMPVGIGLSARNSVAVVEGLSARGGEFRRTPKRGSSHGLLERARHLPVAESLLMLYFMMTMIGAITGSEYSYLPFLSLFLVGYSHAAVRGWAERFGRPSPGSARQPLPQAGEGCTSVVIPAFNEERSIGHVLRALPRVDDVIVVDNGSSDATAAIARANGARVISQPERGYGAACLAGIAALNPATSIVVFLDADYSDYPEDLTDLLEPLISGRADFVIGSRTRIREARRALSLQQRWGNWLATRLVRLLWDHSYSDLGPFRAIRKGCLDGLRMSDRNFGWNIEMQIKALQTGLRVTEVPVRYRTRIGESKISGTVRGTVLAGTKILYTIGKYAWR